MLNFLLYFFVLFIAYFLLRVFGFSLYFYLLVNENIQKELPMLGISRLDKTRAKKDRNAHEDGRNTPMAGGGCI